MKITPFPILAFTLFGVVAGALAQPVDTLSFGVAESEKAHALTAKLSEITKGGLEDPARTLLPREPVEWQGGKVAFTMKVDPALPNYFTVKLWGGDRTRNRLTLFCGGRGEKAPTKSSPSRSTGTPATASTTSPASTHHPAFRSHRRGARGHAVRAQRPRIPAPRLGELRLRQRRPALPRRPALRAPQSCCTSARRSSGGCGKERHSTAGSSSRRLGGN